MKKEKLKFKNIIQSKYIDKKYKKKFNLRFNSVFLEIQKKIEENKNVLQVLNKNFKFNFKVQELEKFKKFKKIVIVGMGGSILGVEALFQFLNHKIKKNVIFIDNIDDSKSNKIKIDLNAKKTLFIIISKSGNTIETLSNLIYLKIVRKNAKNIIIISEKRNNHLHLLAKKNNLFFLEHKKYIGGRYSVLSEVGMLPAYLMGINIKKIKNSLKNNFSAKRKLFLKDSVIKLAYLLKNKKFNNLIFINYVPELEKFLFWLQQLLAESLGKKNFGFLPVISNSPKDHHSLLQLYLDGPKDKIFCIFCMDDNSGIKLNTKMFSNNLSMINKKSLKKIKNSQKNALTEVLSKYKIPHREFVIKSLKEDIIGELFSYFIMETVVIGKILNINPFDQPAVEQVKILTKKNLSK